MPNAINFVQRFYSKNTIYALSSGLGKCGVAVIRVTGPNTKDALKYIGGFKDLPEPRKVMLRSLRDVNNGEIIDKGLVLWFPGPKSFTGEDSCEFQVHGSVAVINGISKSLNSIPSISLAEPGEFTRRAFYNGKLDLTEVEGLADLLNAETEIQRKQAFLQSQGFLSKMYHQWKDELTRYQAHVEAMIDFEESENLGNQMQHVFQKVMELKNKLKKHISAGRKGEILKQGVQTVIVGQPNVGKSSLFNILCGRPAAIVTPISGTTRDIIEIKLDISGYPVILSDTAGIREDSDDPIEKEGMKRAIDQVETAELVILMMVAHDYYSWIKANKLSTLSDYMKLHLEMLGLEKVYSDYKQNKKRIIPVINKVDLSLPKNDDNLLCVSCTTGLGIDDLVNQITRQLKEICGEPSKEHLCMNNARHREHLKDCLEELDMFLKNSEALNSGENIDIVILAEHLRRASKHLGRLVGKTFTDGILDVIFRDFCIGK
ncbi:tRNA modification GTPase GTPBP3, mitochondrial [Coccinella septempunctata]|uniref:tRNA modification GTPase GTPBP3, mitochondrial n=1 Tax=Coccinella septempunctata TaxID=41139 RepID=UPI001D090F18|nr:tRNA modification GTPase GTPBP3, mitochondrial [Coccinella septempunctata]XP_044764629.1 tRNA modification GTPase GTPBP3, mitochondrial [Coccinella septempunctata]XP_044764630.1 tRNA modification GTPase GTPBP3, mitochondrial [Coccinella septempunctata]